MARRCEFCGRGSTSGRSIIRKGLPKRSGGVGLKTTGISKRVFKANIHRVRARVGGSVRRVKVCSRCLRAGKVIKP
jgi:large subunit ribosomal protein L28